MVAKSESLEQIEIASPCPADWDQLQGDDRVRFCSQCQLHVYNLSGLSQREAMRLVTEHEGRLCIRMFRRADGTVMTRDCPVGLRAARRHVMKVAAAILGLFASLSWANLVYSGAAPQGASSHSKLGNILRGFVPTEPRSGGWVMGARCVPTTPASTSTAPDGQPPLPLTTESPEGDAESL